MTKQPISRIAQFRVSRRRSTALAFLFVFALGCGQKSQPAAAPAKAAADAPTDQSLTTEQYVELGLPAPDRPWTGEEMTQAAEVLSRIAAGGAERLPRYRSERSGEVFARLTSADNLEVVTRDSLPATV